MLQVRVGCRNKSCKFFSDIEVLNLPIVGRNKVALPVLLCDGCTHILDVAFVDPSKEGVVIDDSNSGAYPQIN